MIFFNVLFSSVIAFGVVYNAARISLSERSRELASLRVLGFTRAEISMILLGELAVILLIAVPAGLVLGYALAALVVTAFDTELFRFPLVVSPRTFAFAAMTTVVAAVGLRAHRPSPARSPRPRCRAENAGVDDEDSSRHAWSSGSSQRSSLGSIAWSFRPQPVPVDFATVSRGTLRVTIDEDGMTRVRERYVVSAPVAGRMQPRRAETRRPGRGEPDGAGDVSARHTNPARPAQPSRGRGAAQSRSGDTRAGAVSGCSARSTTWRSAGASSHGSAEIASSEEPRTSGLRRSSSRFARRRPK